MTRHGARGEMTSVYCRDPDGNLIEIAVHGKAQNLRTTWCGQPGSNRHSSCEPRDFKSLASTNFAMPACAPCSTLALGLKGSHRRGRLPPAFRRRPLGPFKPIAATLALVLRDHKTFDAEVQSQIHDRRQRLVTNHVTEIAVTKKLNDELRACTGGSERGKGIATSCQVDYEISEFVCEPLIRNSMPQLVPPPRVWVRASQTGPAWRDPGFTHRMRKMCVHAQRLGDIARVQGRVNNQKVETETPGVIFLVTHVEFAD